jgi:hypothetical protein
MNRSGWLALVLVSCAPAETSAPRTVQAGAPGADPVPSATAPERGPSPVPDALRCGKVLPETCGTPKRSFDEVLSGEPKPEESLVAGQMTQASAAAKRLFDGERWEEAASALTLVANGSTGDDIGNRQIAEYHLAIALSRAGDWNAAKDLFSFIAQQPGHLKNRESFVWLAKALSGECVTMRVVRAAAEYDPKPLDFGSERQREALMLMRFARARGLMELGDRDQARIELQELSREPKFADVAAECLRSLG